MKKDLILLKTVKSFCEIAVGEQELQLKDATGSPDRIMNHPLFESAKDLLHSSLRKGISQMIEKKKKVLPERMTHSKLIDPFIVEPYDAYIQSFG